MRTDRQTDYFHDDKQGNLTRLYNILITYTFYNLDFGKQYSLTETLVSGTRTSTLVHIPLKAVAPASMVVMRPGNSVRFAVPIPPSETVDVCPAKR